MGIKYVKLSVSVHGIDAEEDAPSYLVGWLRAATESALRGGLKPPELFKFRDEFENDIVVEIEETASESSPSRPLTIWQECEKLGLVIAPFRLNDREGMCFLCMEGFDAGYGRSSSDFYAAIDACTRDASLIGSTPEEALGLWMERHASSDPSKQ